jgi:cephalosporin hydroxylase
VLAMQELLWRVRPDVVVECGVAHGGALVLYASILDLVGKGRVIGIDVEIRKYNRLAIESHPMSKRITLVEGSSVDEEVSIAAIKRRVAAASSRSTECQCTPE